MRKKAGRKILIAVFWIVIWQIAAAAVHNPILLAGPFDTAVTLGHLVCTAEFWLSVAGSLIRITAGFFCGAAAGILLAVLCSRYGIVKELLEPPMLFFKSVPVASFVILALIWAGSRNLSIFIAFIVVLPVIYVNTISGLESTDQKLLEMAAIFRLPLWKRVRFIYLPALVPYLLSACRTALGMSWKSGVAAEVIGLPDHSIGERLYLSKIYLETADLFAWTLVIITISALFERIVLYLISRLCPPSADTLLKGESSRETADRSSV